MKYIKCVLRSSIARSYSTFHSSFVSETSRPISKMITAVYTSPTVNKGFIIDPYTETIAIHISKEDNSDGGEMKS